MRNSFIVCDNLVRIYKVVNLEVVALQGLNMSVSDGEMVGIVGVSGSGKSTLMNILGGLDRPSAGRVWVNGQDLLKLSDIELDRFRRETVGFVWQQSSRNLIPFLSAIENVQMPINLTSGMSRESQEYTAYLLETVGMADRMDHRLSELSGGQQQRVAIAVSLANRPKLLLADEPTGEVDHQTALDIYKTFKDLNKEFGLTTLVVSHDPAIAKHMDRVVAIRDGQLATETVRQNKILNGSRDKELVQDDEVDVLEEDEFEELIVLDSSGRLQLPKELREQRGLRHRVRIEEVEEGILIKPANDVQFIETTEQMVDELEEQQLSFLDQAVHKASDSIGKLLGSMKKRNKEMDDK